MYIVKLAVVPEVSYPILTIFSLFFLIVVQLIFLLSVVIGWFSSTLSPNLRFNLVSSNLILILSTDFSIVFFVCFMLTIALLNFSLS